MNWGRCIYESAERGQLLFKDGEVSKEADRGRWCHVSEAMLSPSSQIITSGGSRFVPSFFRSWQNPHAAHLHD